MLGVSDVGEILAVPLIGIIPEDDNVVISTNTGEPLALKASAPASRAFENIAGRLVGRDIPLPDPESLDEKGFLSGLKKIFARQGGRV
jgi:septum site-determining protein MinD